MADTTTRKMSHVVGNKNTPAAAAGALSHPLSPGIAASLPSQQGGGQLM